MHKPFNLYKRTTKNASIYYVRFYTEDGRRLPGRSTGQTTKSAAEAWCYEQLKKGAIPSQKRVSFGKWAEDWWIWDKCEYVQSRLARGRNLSRRYVDGMRGLLKNHILPYFKDKSLSSINRPVIEDWIIKLSKKKGRYGRLSTTSIN